MGLRKCTECGKPMFEGYCINTGDEYFCSAKCLWKNYTPEDWEAMYEDGGDSYWTTWEEECESCDEPIRDGNIVLDDGTCFCLKCCLEELNKC